MHQLLSVAGPLTAAAVCDWISCTSSCLWLDLQQQLLCMTGPPAAVAYGWTSCQSSCLWLNLQQQLLCVTGPLHQLLTVTGPPTAAAVCDWISCSSFCGLTSCSIHLWQGLQQSLQLLDLLLRQLSGDMQGGPECL